jgi:hypothetical protein
VSNDRLMANLDDWARENARIDPAVFDCHFYKKCNASMDDKLDPHGKNCMMSYVGREFGCDEPFRLVIVGMDNGSLGGGNFEYRRASLERWLKSGNNNFNPHYRGLVKTAAAVFGVAGEHCRKKCTKRCQKMLQPSSPCVITKIVQPNLVKCKPVDTVNHKSRATRQMRHNCAHHLIEELKLLRPNLVVFHGVNAREAVRAAIAPHVLRPIKEIKDTRGPVIYEWQDLSAHLLFLNHPSYNNLEKQWEPVVVPALDYLRARRLIPV